DDSHSTSECRWPELCWIKNCIPSSRQCTEHGCLLISVSKSVSWMPRRESILASYCVYIPTVIGNKSLSPVALSKAEPLSLSRKRSSFDDRFMNRDCRRRERQFSR